MRTDKQTDRFAITAAETFYEQPENTYVREPLTV